MFGVVPDMSQDQPRQLTLSEAFEKLHIRLAEYKEMFFLKTEIIWYGIFPTIFLDGLEYEIEEEYGKLRVWRDVNAYTFEFITDTDERYCERRPLGEEVEEGCQDYEELLFCTWPYDGNTGKWPNEMIPGSRSNLPEWHVSDPSYACWLEDYAVRVENVLVLFSDYEHYRPLCDSIFKIIRNGLPKWQCCVVQWTFIKDLDTVIKQVEITKKQLMFSKSPVTSKPKSNLQLTDTEKNVIEAINTKTLMGQEIADKAGYPFNSNFKNTLSSLRKRNILGNKMPGYYLLPEHHHLLDES